MIDSKPNQDLLIPSIPDHIFREYDIRGIYEQDLSHSTACIIGKALAVYLKNKINKPQIKLTVGSDIRLSSPILKEGVIKGLLESGMDIIEIGVCPTPLQYYSLYSLEADGGVMVTGSHNPPEFNGFKLSVGKQTIFGEEIQEIRRIIRKGDYISTSQTANLSSHDILKEYTNYLIPKFKSFAGLKVVVDSGNGTAGLIAPKIMKALGAEVIELFSEPDGRFPNHHPDPVVLENLQYLRNTVLESKAHVGIGFDGDADRIGVIDEEGEPIWGDILMIAFARDLLKDYPKATIIGEVKCSQLLYDEINRLGGRALMWKTGHSLIKKKMKEEGALLAGEMSGHLFFADRYFGYDDAIYTALRLMEIMKKSGPPFGVRNLLKGIPKVYNSPEIRVDCPDTIKFKIVEDMKREFANYPANTIDGIRINFPQGWALIRASNTQPVLVLRFEADSTEELKIIGDQVREKLTKIMNKYET